MCTMFLKRAMRYYRVWIYCCNIALFAATLVFVVLLIWFLTDIHMSLFPSISLYHPSFIYGFLALVLQGGVVQVSTFCSQTVTSRKVLVILLMLNLLHDDVTSAATHSLLISFLDSIFVHAIQDCL